MKRIPTPAHAALRAKLSRLIAASTHAGEIAGAKEKLSRLEGKYDFAQVPEEDDIFAGIKVTAASGTASELLSFAPAESDIATLAQWVIANRFKVSSAIRTGADWRSSLWVEVSKRDLAALRSIAETVREHFGALWQSMQAHPHVDAGDRRPFLLGLYDGMMDDPRAPGSMLPARSFPPRKGRKTKTKRKAIAHAPGVALHPYSLALDLGRKIRLRASVAQTTEALAGAFAGALPAAA